MREPKLWILLPLSYSLFHIFLSFLHAVIDFVSLYSTQYLKEQTKLIEMHI